MSIADTETTTQKKKIDRWWPDVSSSWDTHKQIIKNDKALKDKRHQARSPPSFRDPEPREDSTHPKHTKAKGSPYQEIETNQKKQYPIGDHHAAIGAPAAPSTTTMLPTALKTPRNNSRQDQICGSKSRGVLQIQKHPQSTSTSAGPRILKALWRTIVTAPRESRPYIKSYNIFTLFSCKSKINILISFNLIFSSVLGTEVDLIPTKLSYT